MTAPTCLEENQLKENWLGEGKLELHLAPALDQAAALSCATTKKETMHLQ